MRFLLIQFGNRTVIQLTQGLRMLGFLNFSIISLFNGVSQRCFQRTP